MITRFCLSFLLCVGLFVAAGCSEGGGTKVTAPKNANRTDLPKLDPKMQSNSAGGVSGTQKKDTPPLLD